MGNNYLNRLQVLFTALISGQVLFFVIAIFMRYKKLMPDTDEQLNKALQVIALLLAFAGFFAGNKIFNKKIKLLKDADMSVAEKMKQYQTASIIKWGMLEGACIFAIVGHLLTGNYAFVALAVVLLFIFAGYNPVKNKIIQQLGLNEEEAAQL